jgi:hypothetical protein
MTHLQPSKYRCSDLFVADLSAETSNNEEQEQVYQVPCGKQSYEQFGNVPSLYVVQARIKKIMQKDDEVGKVAQATPVLICK